MQSANHINQNFLRQCRFHCHELFWWIYFDNCNSKYFPSKISTATRRERLSLSLLSHHSTGTEQTLLQANILMLLQMKLLFGALAGPQSSSTCKLLGPLVDFMGIRWLMPKTSVCFGDFFSEEAKTSYCCHYDISYIMQQYSYYCFCCFSYYG